jgi:hypothetical protein
LVALFLFAFLRCLDDSSELLYASSLFEEPMTKVPTLVVGFCCRSNTFFCEIGRTSSHVIYFPDIPEAAIFAMGDVSTTFSSNSASSMSPSTLSLFLQFSNIIYQMMKDQRKK